MDGQAHGGHPFRQIQDLSRCSTTDGRSGETNYPTSFPSGEQSQGSARASLPAPLVTLPDGTTLSKRKCRPGMGWRSPRAASAISYLYAIQCNEFIKIGVSNDPEVRIRELQAANPYPLKIVGRWRIVRDFREDIERYAHELLRARRVHLEWFRAKPDEAARAIECALQFHMLVRDEPALGRKTKRPLDLLDAEFSPPAFLVAPAASQEARS